MKKTIFLFSLCCLLFSSAAIASIPVNKKNVEKQEIVTQDQINDQVASVANVNLVVSPEEALSPAAATASDNTMVILLLLWFFLGLLAAHRWYAKKPAGWNLLFIFTLGGFGIWAIVDLIGIIGGDFME
jgi:hypothetical protein